MSACGMRTYSACVPSIMLPRIQPPLRQCEYIRFLQKSQLPHAVMHEMMTLSPTRNSETPAPTCSTTPTPSWPRMRPSGTTARSPFRMCRSVPQIVDVVDPHDRISRLLHGGLRLVFPCALARAVIDEGFHGGGGSGDARRRHGQFGSSHLMSPWKRGGDESPASAIRLELVHNIAPFRRERRGPRRDSGDAGESADERPAATQASRAGPERSSLSAPVQTRTVRTIRAGAGGFDPCTSNGAARARPSNQRQRARPVRKKPVSTLAGSTRTSPGWREDWANNAVKDINKGRAIAVWVFTVMERTLVSGGYQRETADEDR